jgi:hypothetical protein
MARWCRERLGRAMFPVGLPAEEVAPLEEGLARLEELARARGQTAEELLATRLTLRPEVRAQLRAAPWPYLVISRQLAFALEDIRPRAPVGRQDPPVPVPDPRRNHSSGKPEWMSEEEFEYYRRQEQEMIQRRIRQFAIERGVARVT